MYVLNAGFRGGDSGALGGDWALIGCASHNPCMIRPLIAAMCFHQLFEEMVLEGCILQVNFNNLYTPN